MWDPFIKMKRFRWPTVNQGFGQTPNPQEMFTPHPWWKKSCTIWYIWYGKYRSIYHGFIHPGWCRIPLTVSIPNKPTEIKPHRIWLHQLSEASTIPPWKLQQQRNHVCDKFKVVTWERILRKPQHGPIHSLHVKILKVNSLHVSQQSNCAVLTLMIHRDLRGSKFGSGFVDHPIFLGVLFKHYWCVPTNHPFRKENDLPTIHDYVPC